MLTMLFLAAAATAVSPAAQPKQPQLIPTSFDLADESYEDPARWLLPEISDQFDRREPARLRWRGKKVKLRVPL